METESRALRVLRTAVASGRWERPWLLVGPAGGARDAAATDLVRAVLCERREGGDGRPCDDCGACHRTRRDLHPDLHLLEPAKGRAGIGVDPVEALQARLALRPVEGRGTAVLVPDADRLTTAAQNALLKTLEEPPPRTVLVLRARATRAFLTTVRSRCAQVRFPPLDDATLRRRALAAAGGDPAAAEGLIAASAGDPEHLAAAADAGLGDAVAALALAMAPRPATGPEDPLEHLQGAVAWVRGKGGDLEGQRLRLRLALRLLLDLHAPGAGSRYPVEGAGGYDRLPSPARRERLRALGEARERVERNVDPAGILEALGLACRTADVAAFSHGAGRADS